MTQRPYDCVLFDLDGTLSDPSPGFIRCFNEALALHDLPPAAPQELIRWIGPPIENTFRAFAPATDEAGITRLIIDYRARYAEYGFSGNIIYSGIPELLHQLSAADFDLGVCSSKRTDFVEKILHQFGIHHCFRFINGGDIGIEKTQQLRSLLDDGEIDQSAVMIGDRRMDVTAAKNNELKSVGVLWGFGDREELEVAGADVIVDSVSELAELLLT